MLSEESSERRLGISWLFFGELMWYLCQTTRVSHSQSCRFLRYFRQLNPCNPYAAHALAHLALSELVSCFSCYHASFAADDHYGLTLTKLLHGPSFLWCTELAGSPRKPEQWSALRACAASPNPTRPSSADISTERPIRSFACCGAKSMIHPFSEMRPPRAAKWYAAARRGMPQLRRWGILLEVVDGLVRATPAQVVAG